LIENADLNLPNLYLKPPLGVTPLKFRRDLWHWQTSPWAIVRRCLRDRDPRFSHLSRTSTDDGRTDERTQR